MHAPLRHGHACHRVQHIGARHLRELRVAGGHDKRLDRAHPNGIGDEEREGQPRIGDGQEEAGRNDARNQVQDHKHTPLVIAVGNGSTGQGQKN